MGVETVKIRVLKNGPTGPTKVFLTLRTYDKQLAIEKRGYLIKIGHTEALLLKKTLNGHFSRPAQTDPYVDWFMKYAGKWV